MALTLEKITSAFKKMSQSKDDGTVVGVDFGSAAVKVVQLKDKGGKPQLVTYGELQLGPYGNIAPGRAANLSTAKLTEAFIDIVRESSVTSKQASLAIPYNASFITSMTIDSVEKDKVEAMIPVEARKYVPIPLNEVTMDWFATSTSAETSQTRVLLVAIYNEGLQKYQLVVTNTGIANKATEIEVFSALRSVASGPGNVGVIDLGAAAAKLYVSVGSVVTKTHSIRVGGSEITNRLSQVLGGSFEEAEQLKQNIGLDSDMDGKVSKVLRDVLGRGLREMDQVLRVCEEESGVHIDEIKLIGGGALTKGIVPYVQDIFSRSVTVANPFGAVEHPAFLDDSLQQAGPIFAPALGAALRVFS